MNTKENIQTLFHRSKKSFSSEAIWDAEYSRRLKALDITFQGGKVYRYTSVNPRTYREFLRAASKGRFFQQTIRPNFTCYRLVKQI